MTKKNLLLFIAPASFILSFVIYTNGSVQTAKTGVLFVSSKFLLLLPLLGLPIGFNAKAEEWHSWLPMVNVVIGGRNGK